MADLLSNVIGFPSISGIQRTYNWDFLLPDIFGILVSGMVVSKYCQSVRVGQYDIAEVSEIQAGPFKKRFAGTLDIDTVAATFVTPVPDLISLYFSKWKSLEVDEKGRYNVANVYKKTAHVILYDRTGIPSNIVRLIGIFPTKFPKFDLSYKTEEAHMFEVTFSIDRIEMGLKALGGFGKEVVDAVGNVAKMLV